MWLGINKWLVKIAIIYLYRDGKFLCTIKLKVIQEGCSASKHKAVHHQKYYLFHIKSINQYGEQLTAALQQYGRNHGASQSKLAQPPRNSPDRDPIRQKSISTSQASLESVQSQPSQCSIKCGDKYNFLRVTSFSLK